MAHGLNSVVLKRNAAGPKSPPTTPDGTGKPSKTGIGSRRIFAPHFKLQVLDSYRNDPDCKGNQRATARKYGIHRRQIQKWLQVEHTLRNTIQNNNNNNYKTSDKQHMNAECKMDAVTLNGARPRVVDSITDGRGAPLDYTTHGHHPAPTLSPIDLSVKRESITTPSPPTVTMTTTFYYNNTVSPPPTSNEDNDAWDLSTKASKRKLSDDDTSLSKPIKLFKPYLDDIKEEEPTRAAQVASYHPPCCSRSIHVPEPIYYTNNNNNIVSEPYTIAELQPKGNVYYYTYNNIIYHPDYDGVGANGNYYEENGHFMGANMKQHRQTYSLDFKLSAIDCYYQDSICKGNQRAVATKYNIHRRQVQKWLKQADELRMRNESMKQMHTVVR